MLNRWLTVFTHPPQPQRSPPASHSHPLSLNPTITETPSVTPTPEKSHTPTITLTPAVPLAIEAQFEGNLAIPENVAFSALEFSNQGLDSLYRPIEPSAVFTNPIGTMYSIFSYDGMENGVQWTAIWYRNNELVNFETKPWDGSTGGIGFSDWAPRAEEWLPGEYQVQIFIGLDWLRVGFFNILGTPPTSTPTSTQTPSDTPTPSSTFTNSPVPS